MAKSLQVPESTSDIAGFILIQDPSPFFEDGLNDEDAISTKRPSSSAFGQTDPILASGDWSEEEIKAALKLQKLTFWQRVRLFFCA